VDRKAVVLILGWFALVLWNFKYHGNLHSAAEILQATSHLDVGWYQSIAMHGYRIDPAATSGQSTVFFPLFPAFVAPVIHWLGVEPLLAMNIIQKLFLILMFFLVWAWAKAQSLCPRESLMALLLHPAAVFLLVPYTESLYLCCLFGLFIAWSRKHTAGVFVCALLLGLCRPTGLFILPAAALTLLVQSVSMAKRHAPSLRSGVAALSAGLRDPQFRDSNRCLVFACLGATSALLLVALVMHVSVSDWFAFYRYRSLWKEEPGWSNFRSFLNLDLGFRFPRVLTGWLAVVGCALLLRRGRVFEACVSLMSVMLPVYQGKIPDIIRYTLGAAPAWIILYEHLKTMRPVQWLLAGFSVSTLLLLMQAWLQRQWVG